jgi:hypothetical protein
MYQPIPLHDPLPNLIEAITPSQQHSFILMIPKIRHNFLPLQKLHLFLHTTPHHPPITELHKEINANTDQLQYLKIKAININNFPFLIDRQHILQHQTNKISISQKRPKCILDPFYLRHRIQPKSPRGQ